jgi:hypothetical protein
VTSGQDQAERLTGWLNIHFLHGVKDTLQNTCVMLYTKKKMGVLDEISCFHHVAKRQRLLTCNGRPQLELSRKWKDSYATFAEQVKTSFAANSPEESPPRDVSLRNRCVMFDVLFKRCIPNKEIWAGFFRTDGFNLRMGSHDPSIYKVPAALAAQVEEEGLHQESATALDLLRFMVSRTTQSFCRPETFGKDTIGVLHRFQEGQRLLEEEPRPVSGTGAYARRHLGSKKLQIVQKLPTESTLRGIPKGISRLEEGANQAVRDAMSKLLDGTPDKGCIIAGNDLGIRVAQAIHVNHPPAARSYARLFQDEEASKPSPSSSSSSSSAMTTTIPSLSKTADSSFTFLVGPHTLQDISRQSGRKKQWLRKRIAIDTFDILEKRKFTSGSAEGLSKMYNLVDLALKGSREYCHTDFRRVQLTRRFHDKVATEFSRAIWPDGDSIKTPVLFAIGDACGLSSMKANKHHADYGASSLRELIKRVKNQKLPVHFVVVDEAYSSQVCPDPCCKDKNGFRSM